MHPLTETWWRLLVNRTDCALRFRGTTWICDPQPLTPVEVSRALMGEQALGAYAVDEKGLSRWLCLDADTADGQAALAKVARQRDGPAPLFEHSRRGAHLWRFCPPTPWAQVRAYGELLAAEAGIRCEVFPKSGGRTGVRLPLTPHPKTGTIYPLVDPATGAVRAIADLLQLRRQPLAPVLPQPAPASTPINPGERGDFATLFREVEQVTRLRQFGPERAIGCCPFHDDRRPSLSILGGFWRCWAGCGEGGVGAFRARIRKRGV